MKRKTYLLAAALPLLLLSACAGKNSAVTTGKTGVVRDEEFGNIYIDLTIDEFNAKGFSFGDSVDVSFSNGEKIENIPYYSGYYTPVGELLACGYPGYPHVVIARNYGNPTWEEFHMTSTETVTVTLREKGAFAAVQELFALSYPDERSAYGTDIQYANFRAVSGGNLKENAFYRSASPCDNQHGRAAFANRLAEEAGVRSVLNLSDSAEKYALHRSAADFDSAYYDSLVEGGSVQFLAMSANYRSDAFAQTLSQALYEATRHETPCLIHCVEGKDRTGFACTLLLALADASADEIAADYMITFANYYGVTKEQTPEKYEAIRGNVDDFLCCLCDAGKGTDVQTLDLRKGAERYLRQGGLTDPQIAEIEAFLVK